MPDHSTRVIVAGAGPVGCTAAALLVARGVEVLMLESEAELPKQLRASTFHPPTLELYDRFGIVERMKADGLVAPAIQYRDRDEGLVAEFDLGVLAGDTTHPYRVQVEQWRVCRYLLDDLNESDLFTIEWGAEVVDVVQDTDRVRVTTADGSEHSAAYLVGADGSHSAVRKSQSIDFEGWTYEDRYLVVSTPFELLDAIPDLALINYVADPKEWLVLLRTKPLWRVLFPIAEPETDAEALTPDAVQRRLHGVVDNPGDFQIGHTTMYNVHQRVATSFRSGRVVLAGDAAHINSPLGGMGLNNGVHDAWLLGDMLADIIQDESASGVLDEYSKIRRAISIDHVQKTTHHNAVTLSSRDPGIRYQALEDLRTKAATTEGQREYLLQASMLNAVADMKSAVGGLW